MPPPRGKSERSAWATAFVIERPFHALRAPLRADARAGQAPDFLRVGLEKSRVELAPEAVDEEILERDLRADGEEARPRVARADAGHAGEAEIGDRPGAERYRVIKEPAQEVDAAAAGAQQHHFIALRRVRAAGHADLAGASLVSDLLVRRRGLLKGIIARHHSITRSDFEKKRWPPMSMRLPL